jgi:hypothetical protein
MAKSGREGFSANQTTSVLPAIGCAEPSGLFSDFGIGLVVVFREAVGWHEAAILSLVQRRQFEARLWVFVLMPPSCGGLP